MNSKQKGKRGELEAARAWVESLGCTARRGQQLKGTQDSPDVETSIDGLHVEVKRTECLRLWEAVEQACRDCGANVPLVLHRSNRHPWVAIVRLEDLRQLMAVLARHAAVETAQGGAVVYPHLCLNTGCLCRQETQP